MGKFDIGSRIEWFMVHLLSMGMNVSSINIRDFSGEVEKHHTIVEDATSLKQVANSSIESRSTLYSLEHFGLGRYDALVDQKECFNRLTLKEFFCTANGKIEYNVELHKYNGDYRYG